MRLKDVEMAEQISFDLLLSEEAEQAALPGDAGPCVWWRQDPGGDLGQLAQKARERYQERHKRPATRLYLRDPETCAGATFGGLQVIAAPWLPPGHIAVQGGNDGGP